MEPLAVWDAREPDWLNGREAKTQWLKKQGLPVNKMYRAEFLLTDAPCVRIFCYALDDRGLRHWAQGHVWTPHDHDACGAAREEPRIVPLSDLPPRELLGT